MVIDYFGGIFNLLASFVLSVCIVYVLIPYLIRRRSK